MVARAPRPCEERPWARRPCHERHVTPEEYEDSYQFRPGHRGWVAMHLRPIANFLGGAFMTVATLGYARLVAPFKTEFVEVPMPLRNLASSFEGFRIVQLSDFHAGDVPVSYLRRVVGRVNEMRYDLAVFTGDFVSHDLKFVREAAEVLGGLRRPMAVGLGNHA